MSKKLILLGDFIQTPVKFLLFKLQYIFLDSVDSQRSEEYMDFTRMFYFPLYKLYRAVELFCNYASIETDNWPEIPHYSKHLWKFGYLEIYDPKMKKFKNSKKASNHLKIVHTIYMGKNNTQKTSELIFTNFEESVEFLIF